MRSTLLFLVLSVIHVADEAEGNTNNGQVTLSRSRRTAKLNHGKSTSSRSRKKNRKWGPTLYQIPDMYNGPLLEHESRDLDYFEDMDYYNENYQGISPHNNKYNENDYSTNINSRGIHNNKNYYMDNNNNINRNGLYGSFDGTQGLVDNYHGGYNGKINKGFQGGEQTGFGPGDSGFGNSKGYPQMFGESHNRNEIGRNFNKRLPNMVRGISNSLLNGNGFGNNLINERLSDTVAGISNGFLKGNGYGNINERLSNIVEGNSNGVFNGNGYGNNLINAGRSYFDNKIRSVFQNGGYFNRAASRRGNDGYFGKIDGLGEKMLNGRLGKRDVFSGNNPRYFDGMRMKNLGESFMNSVKNIGQSNGGLRQGFYDQMNKIRQEIIPIYRGNNGDIGMSNGATKDFSGQGKFELENMGINGPGQQEIYVGGNQGLKSAGNLGENGMEKPFINGVGDFGLNGRKNRGIHNYELSNGVNQGFGDGVNPGSKNYGEQGRKNGGYQRLNGVPNQQFVDKAPMNMNDLMHYDKTTGAIGGNVDRFVDVGEPIDPYKGGIDSFPGAPL